MITLYKKESRRYVEASEWEILFAASIVLAKRAMPLTANRLRGMSEILEADEKSAPMREAQYKLTLEEKENGQG